MRRIILALMLIVLLMCLQASAALAQEDVLDLRGMSFSSAGEISALIDARPETTAVDLTGAPLPLDVCREIITQYPDIRFIYTLSLFGLEVSSEAESVDFAGCDVNYTERLIAGIDCLSFCYLDVQNCSRHRCGDACCAARCCRCCRCCRSRCRCCCRCRCRCCCGYTKLFFTSCN